MNQTGGIDAEMGAETSKEVNASIHTAAQQLRHSPDATAHEGASLLNQSRAIGVRDPPSNHANPPFKLPIAQPKTKPGKLKRPSQTLLRSSPLVPVRDNSSSNRRSSLPRPDAFDPVSPVKPLERVGRSRKLPAAVTEQPTRQAGGGAESGKGEDGHQSSSSPRAKRAKPDDRAATVESTGLPVNETAQEAPEKKKRGRPAKHSASANVTPRETPEKKKRGRPAKHLAVTNKPVEQKANAKSKLKPKAQAKKIASQEQNTPPAIIVQPDEMLDLGPDGVEGDTVTSSPNKQRTRGTKAKASQNAAPQKSKQAQSQKVRKPTQKQKQPEISPARPDMEEEYVVEGEDLDTPPEDEDAEESEDDPEATVDDHLRFYGQMRNLRQSIKAARHIEEIGFMRRLQRKTHSIKRLKEACIDARHCIELLQEEEREDELAQLLRQIRTRLRTVFDDESTGIEILVRDIHVHAIPSLFDVTKTMLLCFETHANASAHPHGTLTLPHLTTVTTFLTPILDFTSRLPSFRKDHLSELQGHNIIRRADKIVACLRQITTVFTKTQLVAQRRETALANAAANAERLRIQQEQAEQQEEEDKARREWAKKWQALHTKRLGVELWGRVHLPPDVERLRRHLRYVPVEDAMAVCSELEWPDEAVWDLWSGLEKFAGKSGSREAETTEARKKADPHAGPLVYETIFEAHCKKPGHLRPYNVSEIVAKAIQLRDAMKEDYALEGMEPPRWILEIPDPRVLPI